MLVSLRFLLIFSHSKLRDALESRVQNGPQEVSYAVFTRSENSNEGFPR